MKNKMLAAMRQVAKEMGLELVADINADSVLLETGLDSIGFAVLVAQLEVDLGYDPFTLMDEPYYPRIFGEFVEIYERFAP